MLIFRIRSIYQFHIMMLIISIANRKKLYCISRKFFIFRSPFHTQPCNVRPFYLWLFFYFLKHSPVSINTRAIGSRSRIHLCLCHQSFYRTDTCSAHDCNQNRCEGNRQACHNVPQTVHFHCPTCNFSYHLFVGVFIHYCSPPTILPSSM